ncbi:DMT family transporter [Leptolyngbya sp. FACHB-261]|uniref:DMT family transporter n=1 Tax=Leptolyngbya sp. FACHB-261 TaxID=2692806 RepID=UPI001688BC23|nr:DMT family transporter [Leptolyngbya sp. FACHB-261]MBD2104327.1 DMT family transporter [Leptolyngbya sp. FACHB-261]
MPKESTSPPASGLFEWKSLAAGIGAAASWGMATVMTKGALTHMPPLTLLVVQLLCSNLLLWAVVVAQRLPLPPVQQILRFALPGLLQPGLAFILGLIGLSLTAASIEALIWSTETLMIIGLAWLLLGERLQPPLIALAVFGVVGVALVTATGDDMTSGSNSLLGNLLIFGGTFCAALYTVLIRQRVVDLAPLLLVALNQAIGLLGVLVVWLVWSPATEFAPLSQLGLGIWGLAAISGVMLHAIPFWLHTIVLQRLSASLASLFLTLIPIFTIGGAYLFLGEQLSSIQWIGAACVLLAMAGVSVLYSE